MSAAAEKIVTWFLAAETTAFGAFAALAAYQFRSLAAVGHGNGFAGIRMRAVFIVLLACGCLVRGISLGASLYSVEYGSKIPGFTRFLSPDLQHRDEITVAGVHAVNSRLWVLYLLEALPSLVFLGAYSLVVLFWAQVFYATILVAAGSLSTVFLAGNLILSGIYVLAIVISWRDSNAVQLQEWTCMAAAVGYLIVGSCFAYYGVQVAGQLSSGEPQNRTTRISIVRRIVLLSVACPLLFEIRGVISVASVLSDQQRSEAEQFEGLPLWAWNAVVYLVTELLPVALILQVFSPPSHTDDNTHLISSARLQAPLLDASFVDSLRRQRVLDSADRYRIATSTTTTYQQPQDCTTKGSIPSEAPNLPKTSASATAVLTSGTANLPRASARTPFAMVAESSHSTDSAFRLASAAWLQSSRFQEDSLRLPDSELILPPKPTENRKFLLR